VALRSGLRRVYGRFYPLVQALGDLVFPPICLHCGGLCEGSPLRHLCARCWRLITVVREPHCRTCGHPFFGEVEGERMCPHCVGLHPAFREGRTVTLFQGPARALVIALKYHHGLHVAGDLEVLIRANDHVTSFLRGAVLIPVPLHPRKERERGYNQSAILAEVLAKSVDGCATVAPLLRRVVDTASQTTYDREARRTNLKNAFALAEGVAITPGQHYLLVDDVFTTGSTLNSCARELRRAGGLNLDVVTFGHG